MTDEKRAGHDNTPRSPGRILGSLKDALMAAGRSEAVGEQPTEKPAPAKQAPPLVIAPQPSATPPALSPPGLSPGLDETVLMRRDAPRAVDAVRDAKMPQAPLGRDAIEPTARVRAAGSAGSGAQPQRTQLVRGRVAVARTAFHQDPVVGWLVVVGGPGLGAFRPIFEGNNSIGRGRNQRIAIDFGDDSISSEEQAFLRYDSTDRSFLFVPNLSKTNVVSINDKKPTGAVALAAMDVITMGRTQLAFVPFCGADFDWSELQDQKG
jgi:hypothetical protein